MPLRITVFCLSASLLLAPGMRGVEEEVVKELPDLWRIQVARSQEVKKTEAQYLALLERYHHPAARLAIIAALFELFIREPLTYPDEIIAYASALLALNPAPDLAAKAHAFWAGAIYVKSGDTEESRAARALHQIAILQIALKELGPIREYKDIPRPSNVSYINAVPANAVEKKKYDDHYAKQLADSKSYTRLTALLGQLKSATNVLRNTYQKNQPALLSLAHKQGLNKDEVNKVLAEIFPANSGESK